MALYGVGLNTETNNIILQIKLHIAKSKGNVTVRNLFGIFRDADINQNGVLEPSEFEKALGNFGFFLKRYQYQTLFKYFDQNQDGVINYSEFVKTLREPLSERRLKLILKVYDQLDVNNSGAITVDDIQGRFDVSKHPDVLKGKASPEQVLTEFLNNFEKDGNGSVSKQEFLTFYEDVSAAVRSDSYFVELINTTWGISEEEESFVEDQEIKNIVKILRYKLIQQTSGISDEFLLKKIFAEFDQNQSGNLTLDELYAMTIKLEIPIHKKYLTALFRKFDRNNSGFIEFDEFLYFLTYDPYP